MDGTLPTIIFVSGCNRASWSNFSPDDNEFSILMPSTPSKKDFVVSAGSLGNLTMTAYSSNVDDSNFSVTYTDYPRTFVENSGVNFIIDSGFQKIISNGGNKLIHDETRIDQGIVGRLIEYTTPRYNFTTHCYFCMKGTRYFVVQAVTPTGHFKSREVLRFINSFEPQ